MAGRAREEAGRHHGNQQRHCVEGLVDARPPVLPPGDVAAVLENGEILADLHAHLGAEPLAELRY